MVDKQLKASHRSDLSFSFDSLLHPLSAKQETLFTALVQFHQIKLSALEPVVLEGDRRIDEEMQIEGLEVCMCVCVCVCVHTFLCECV